MEGMGVEGSPWRQMPVQLPNQVLCAVLLVRHGAWRTVKRVFAVLLHRIMAKPELPALRQPRSSAGLLISKVSLYDVREKKCASYEPNRSINPVGAGR